MHTFEAVLQIIGVNPFVFVPGEILDAIFERAGRSKGPIPVRGTVNGRVFAQTLVRYSGEWRLYINTTMLKASPKHVGETISISLYFDPSDRTIPLHPLLLRALNDEPEAFAVFKSLTPSRQNEINRYISRLKSENKVNENVERAVRFLLGKARFVGRDTP